jgi:hypothetical protein
MLTMSFGSLGCGMYVMVSKPVYEERIVFVMSTLHKDLFHPKKGVADIALYMW